MAECSDYDATVDAIYKPGAPDSVSLVFIGPELVQSVSLCEGQSLLVGRTPPADVLLADPAISRQHARFSLEQGVLRIEDAGSRNGVLVNGGAERCTVISASDRVQIGGIDVLTWRASRLAERDALELSALRFAVRLGEELERTRYARRPVWLLALRWPDPVSIQDQLHATRGLRSIDRFCLHTPQLILALLLECDAVEARALAESLRQRAAGRTLGALASAPPHTLSADSMIATVVDRVQRAGASEGLVCVEADVTTSAPESSIVLGKETSRLFDLAVRTAHADLPVLVLGETGAGKEVVARAFHQHSRRARGPFCEINCAALAQTLVESLLFGYEKGAFTGAMKRTPGLFEQSHGGTLFLDEVGELSANAQSALLRALESKRIRRLGATEELEVDVRVIAATNRDLRDLIAKGQFREDLLYRLEALTLRVPPLRERSDEIEPLAQLFLRNAASKWETPARALSEPALRALLAYPWPGNVRQLRNAVERAVAVCPGEVIGIEALPEHVSEAARAELTSIAPATDTVGDSLPEQVRAFEVARIRAALAKSAGNRSQAARLLGLPRRTLGNKLREYDVE